MLVKPFDPTLDTYLVTDASRLYGLGYALLQSHSDNSQRLIKCGSCSLTSTQNNYATIKLECLAIVWAVTKCKYYLHGLQHFTVITDHKPLVGIFNSSLDNLSNPRSRTDARETHGLRVHHYVGGWKNPRHCRRPQSLSNLPG